jgi:hypothetical protein
VWNSFSTWVGTRCWTLETTTPTRRSTYAHARDTTRSHSCCSRSETTETYLTHTHRDMRNMRGTPEHPCHTATPDSSDTDMVKLNTWLPFFPSSSSRLRYIFNNIVCRWILQLLISPFPSNLPPYSPLPPLLLRPRLIRGASTRKVEPR